MQTFEELLCSFDENMLMKLWDNLQILYENCETTGKICTQDVRESEIVKTSQFFFQIDTFKIH